MNRKSHALILYDLQKVKVRVVMITDRILIIIRNMCTVFGFIIIKVRK